jgi:hypothetical protein
MRLGADGVCGLELAAAGGEDALRHSTQVKCVCEREREGERVRERASESEREYYVFPNMCPVLR